MTASVSDTARFFGITERWLPCIVMLSLADKRMQIISVSQTFSLYALLRATLIEFEPLLRHLGGLRQEENRLSKEQSEKEENLRLAEKGLSSVAHVIQSWNEQVEFRLQCLASHFHTQYR